MPRDTKGLRGLSPPAPQEPRELGPWAKQVPAPRSSPHTTGVQPSSGVSERTASVAFFPGDTADSSSVPWQPQTSLSPTALPRPAASRQQCRSVT